MKKDLTKISLREEDIPQQFLNINYYLKKYLGKLPEPPLNPATKKPVGSADLAPLFPMELIKQEVTLDEFVPVPEEVRQFYKTYRPSPLIRAKRLEKALNTPARIYYKYEGVSPAGSHKLNTALVQAYYAKQEGVKRLVTETGAGQWGSALSMAAQFFGLECLVYMVKISFEQKPYRRVIMELFEAKVLSSPTATTKMGRQFLAEKPDTHGSLGMAIAEAIETVVNDKNSKYALGSVLNHVLLHQTIIGQEAINQFKLMGDDPQVVIGCCGGGSNFAGLAFPFLAETLSGKKPGRRFVGVEPSSCASMSKGEYRYDFGDSGRQTPLLKMETLGCDFVPSPIHAGGLRYHGIAPLLSFLHQQKLMEAVNYGQLEVFEAARKFAQAEGIIVAPESAHAVAAAIEEALRAKKERKERAIVFNLSGHGLLDLKGYEDFLQNKLK